MFAQAVGMVAEEFIWVMGDHHVYINQVDGVEEQLSRTPTGAEPRVILNPKIKQVEEFTEDQVQIHGYGEGDYHPIIKFPVAV